MSWIGTIAAPIFIKEDPTIPVGIIGYFKIGNGGTAIGNYGTPIGLLLILTTSSLTSNISSRFIKVIQTEKGFREITF